LLFCKLAVLAGAVPPQWSWPAFLRKAAGLVIFAFEKADAKERWGGENVFAAMMGGRSLRFTGEAIYGSSIQDPDGHANKEHLVEASASAVFPEEGGITSGAAAEAACANVGGWQEWSNFLSMLDHAPGGNIRRG